MLGWRELLVAVVTVGMEVEGVVRETDLVCKATEACMKVSECPYYQERIAHKDSLAKGSPEREEIVQQIRSQVCNSGTRAVCCPCAGAPCVPTSSCPEALSMLKKKKQIQSSNPGAAARILEQLKRNICNRAAKLICCPPTGWTDPADNEVEGEVALLHGGSARLDAKHLARLPHCGVRDGNGQQVIGGEASEAGEFPWAALIGQVRKRRRRHNGSWQNYNETRWSCGGILITTRIVVTAGHCQGQDDRTRIKLVRLGEHTVAGYGQQEESSGKLPPEQNFDIGPKDVFVHEDYKTAVQDRFKYIVNDIALVLLPLEAVLNPGVQVVCLPHIVEEYRDSLGVTNLVADLVGKRPTVVGWGYTSGYDPWSGESQGDTRSYGVASKIQQKLQVPLLDPTTCSEQYNGFQPENTQICAGGELGKDSCKGDSGGGLYVQRTPASPWFLIGIVSFGSKTCGAGRPGVYTRVSEYIPWIKEKLEEVI